MFFTYISHLKVVWHCLVYVSIDSLVLALTQMLDILGETSSFIFSFLGRYLVTFSPLVDNPDDPQVLQHFGVFHFHKIFHTSPVPFKPCMFCSVSIWRNCAWQQILLTLPVLKGDWSIRNSFYYWYIVINKLFGWFQ